MKGLTLVELLLAMSIATVVGVFIFPIGISFIKTQLLEEQAGGLSDTLRRAHSQSIGQMHDSSFGVKILGDSFILFEGESWGTRSLGFDEIFILPTSISASGIDEVVFAQRTGIPSVSGDINLSNNSREVQIEISSRGVIEQ